MSTTVAQGSRGCPGPECSLHLELSDNGFPRPEPNGAHHLRPVSCPSSLSQHAHPPTDELIPSHTLSDTPSSTPHPIPTKGQHSRVSQLDCHTPCSLSAYRSQRVTASPSCVNAGIEFPNSAGMRFPRSGVRMLSLGPPSGVVWDRERPPPCASRVGGSCDHGC